ncbi:MAG: hypothetical protein ACKPKO_08880, partial [Candidatus Fonsibacter sp.]
MPSTSYRYCGVNTGSNDFALLTDNPENGKMSILINGNIYAKGIYALNNNDYNSKNGFNILDNSVNFNNKLSVKSNIEIIPNNDGLESSIKIY